MAGPAQYADDFVGAPSCRTQTQVFQNQRRLDEVTKPLHQNAATLAQCTQQWAAAHQALAGDVKVRCSVQLVWPLLIIINVLLMSSLCVATANAPFVCV